MKARIHFTLPDDYEDSVIVSAPTVDDLRTKANKEVTRRGGRDPWSEILED